MMSDIGNDLYTFSIAGMQAILPLSSIMLPIVASVTFSMPYSAIAFFAAPLAVNMASFSFFPRACVAAMLIAIKISPS